MAKLNLHRASEYVNYMRDYQVYVDGKQVAEIANGKTITLDIEPGRHILHTEIDWCASPKIAFEIKENEEINFNVAAFKGSNIFLLIGLPISLILLLSLFIDFDTEIDKLLLIPSLALLAVLFYYISFGRKKYLKITPLHQH